MRNCICSLTDLYFEELQQMFWIDPYFLRYFVYKIDISYLPSIMEKVPLSILIMRLARDCFHIIKVSSVCSIADNNYLLLYG